MTETTAQSNTPAFSFVSRLYKKPLLGLYIMTIVMCWQAFGHVMTVLLREVLDKHSTIYYAYFLFGALGLGFVWKGFGKDELTQSCFGALGGGLIWFGWFEGTFELLGRAMQIPPLMAINPATGQEFVYYGPGIQLLQMSGVLILPLLILLGLNKDTRCRLFLWFHRRGAKPETPTVGYRRQYSRITALEYIMVTWMIYVVCLVILDARLFAPGGAAMMSVFSVYIAWCGYLFYKLTQQSGVAPTVRYGMAAGICIWLIPETFANAQMMTEIWLKPFEFPITNALITLYMVIGGWIIYTAPDRGVLPKKKKTAT